MGSSSAGRRSAAYKAYGAYLKRVRPPCSIHSGPWCTGIGLTVEHHPPLSTFLHPDDWVGTYSGACKPCQDRQGADIRNGTIPPPTWTF